MVYEALRCGGKQNSSVALLVSDLEILWREKKFLSFNFNSCRHFENIPRYRRISTADVEQSTFPSISFNSKRTATEFYTHLFKDWSPIFKKTTFVKLRDD